MRSIAIGLCDESSASALFRELPGEFVRRSKGAKYVKKGEFGTIELVLIDKDETLYKIITTIIATETFERVHQDEGLWKKEKGKNKWNPKTQDTFPWEKIFVSGYGPGSRMRGVEDFKRYLAVDAVYSIFKYDAPLQNPELAIRRLIDAARKSTKDEAKSNKRADEMLSYIKTILSNMLQLPKPNSIKLARLGVEVKGPWGHAELGELGDGYKATMTWVMDLLSWWLLRISSRGGYLIKNITGIVLVDEIEQHLHPRWQRKIMRLLHEAFPQIQFITSTHSPLCAAGAADIGEEHCQIVNLKRLDGKVVQQYITLPVGLRADQILTSDAFGLSDTRNQKTENKILRYKDLIRKKSHSNSEKNELRDLINFVDLVPEMGQFERERRVRTELRELIKEINKITFAGKNE